MAAASSSLRLGEWEPILAGEDVVGRENYSLLCLPPPFQAGDDERCFSSPFSSGIRRLSTYLLQQINHHQHVRVWRIRHGCEDK